uniref:Uncharacterized protein n=1 Tax=Timema shepardi TaxID=629360 RepID=A0A7R9ASZ8_TIMSH|nr:unnamed protein product [Timema shepardi]
MNRSLISSLKGLIKKAAEYLVRTGSVVVLEVGKQGAIYHGLATLLQQPSPVMTRGVGNSFRVEEWGSQANHMVICLKHPSTTKGTPKERLVICQLQCDLDKLLIAATTVKNA